MNWIKNKETYVTFCITDVYGATKKYAVVCENVGQAYSVATDAVCVNIIKNVRMRQCGKPKDRIMMSYDEYFDFTKK